MSTARSFPLSGLERIHPAVRLLAWGVVVALGQTLEGRPLSLAVGLSLMAGFVLARTHLLHLLRRARFLLLTIGLLFVCATPGEALLPGLGAFSPTAEGLSLAALHGGRLLFVLALLALLVQFTPSGGLVAGVYGLLKPFPGPVRERVALRLMLVLRYSEGQGRRRLTWHEWLHWLEQDERAEEESSLAIQARPLVLPDFLVLTSLILLLVCSY